MRSIASRPPKPLERSERGNLRGGAPEEQQNQVPMRIGLRVDPIAGSSDLEQYVAKRGPDKLQGRTGIRRYRRNLDIVDGRGP